jgi:hypothetical protein
MHFKPGKSTFEHLILDFVKAPKINALCVIDLSGGMEISPDKKKFLLKLSTC